MTSFSPKKVLLTGGAGFIGSNLAHWLCKNTTIETLVVLDKLTYAGNLLSLVDLELPSGCEYAFVRGDICNKAVVNQLFEKYRFDAVLHLAAESHVDRSIEDASAFIQTNVMGSFVLLDAARRAWPQGQAARFVMVSTNEVYGALGETGLFTEETPYAPNSPYAASKASADHLARSFFKTYGLPVIITNCSNNYGPRQFPEKLIPLTIGNAQRGEPLPVYGEGRQVRDWLHVEDHCEGLWAALTRGAVGEKYNFGGGHEEPNLGIVQKIADLVDIALDREPGTARNLITFVKDRLGHDFRYAINPAKARELLGWAPSHTFDSGLEDTVRWYVENTLWVKSTAKENHERTYGENCGQDLLRRSYDPFTI